MPNWSRAASSFSPPRLTNRGRGPCDLDRVAGRDEPGRLVGRCAADGHPTRRRSLPRPARGSRTRPRRTSSASSRRRVGVSLPSGGGLLGRRLLRWRLLGRPSWRRPSSRRPSSPAPSSPSAFFGCGLLLGRPLRRRLGAAALRRSSICDCIEPPTSLRGDLGAARPGCAPRLADLLDEPLGVLPAAFDDLVDQRLGLLGLDLAGPHEITHDRLGPLLGHLRELDAGVEVPLEEVVLRHCGTAYAAADAASASTTGG